jgi:hypothetical protein
MIEIESQWGSGKRKRQNGMMEEEELILCSEPEKQ